MELILKSAVLRCLHLLVDSAPHTFQTYSHTISFHSRVLHWFNEMNDTSVSPANYQLLFGLPCLKDNIHKKLKAHVHKNQTISKILGKCRKMDFAYILTIGRSLCETNTSILSLAEYRFVFEKINNP